MNQEPLTPPDCDLTDFKFMPLEVARLRKSKEWRAGRKKPEIAFYSINLWCASWHEIPAASLEDDDDALAEAAMCDAKTWKRVKDEVMRKWIKCSDGRLYHPIVAEKALESWAKKVGNRERTAAAREARQRKATMTGAEVGTGAKTKSVATSVTEDVTASKGSEVKGSIRESEVKGTTDALTSLNAMTRQVLDDIEPFLNMTSPITGAAVRPWLQAGATPELIITTIRDRTIRRRAGKPGWVPNNLGYFNDAVREEIDKVKAAAAKASADAPTPETARKILETKAHNLNKGRRVEDTTQADVDAMLEAGLTTPEKAVALGYAA